MAKKWIPLLHLQVLLTAISLAAAVGWNEQTAAVFILGDSTADVGTNSFLTDSRFRANIPHNGTDFPGCIATGRFRNGPNSADFLGVSLSLLFKKSILDISVSKPG